VLAPELFAEAQITGRIEGIEGIKETTGVQLFDADGRELLSAFTTHGSFRMNQLGRDVYLLRAESGDTGIASLMLRGEPGKTERVTLQLGKPARVELRFTEALRIALEGGLLRVLDARGRTVLHSPLVHLLPDEVKSLWVEPGTYRVQTVGYGLPLVETTFAIA